MTWHKVINWIVGISLLVALIICGLQFYYIHNYNAPECVYLTDTIVLRKDSIIEKIKYVTEWDTVIDVQYKDTIIHDTVRLPIEHKVDSFTIKKDSLTINEKIHHSGFHSVVDSVELDYNWNYTFQPKKEKKIGFVWYIGLGVGGGVNINVNNRTFDYGPNFGLQGGVGIGGYIK